MAFILPALPAIAAVAGAVGAGVTAYGIHEQGQATKNADNYKAAVAQNNKVVAEQNAKHAEEAGAAQAEAVALKGRATAGRIKAAIAANNVDVNTGSAVDVEESQREQEHLDTETVISNAELQAYGYRTQGVGFDAQSKLDVLSGENAATGADIAAGGSLLSNASSLSFKWSSANPTTPTLPPAQPENI